MPQPSPNDVHISRPLTNISVAFQQAATKYIAGEVFPQVPVENQYNQYYVYPKGFWYRAEAQKRAPATESAGSGWEYQTATYACDVWAVHKDLDDQTLANASAPLNPRREATQWVTGQMLLRRDKEWMSEYLTTGVWGTDRAGVASAPSAGQFLQWNDANSNPIEDIHAQNIAIESATGFQPNTLVMGPHVFNALQDHPDFLDRIKYTQRGIVTEDLIAAVFNIDRVLVARAVENTAVEGAADAMSFMSGKKMLLVYAAPNPGLMTPSGGYTFTWNGLLGASAFGTRISNFPIREKKVTRIEGEMSFDMKVVSPELGVFFNTVVA